MVRMINWALALVFVLLITASCGGGSTTVDVPVPPAQQLTLNEKLQQMGITSLIAGFDPYDAQGNLLRWELLDPETEQVLVQGYGSKQDVVILLENSSKDVSVKVYAKPWIYAEKKYREIEISTYQWVHYDFKLGGRPMQIGQNPRSWTARWFDLEPKAVQDATYSVWVDASDMPLLWNAINNGVLDGFTPEPTNVSVTVSNGQSFDAVFGFLGGGIVGYALAGVATTLCPSLHEIQSYYRPGSGTTPPPPVSDLVSVMVSPSSFTVNTGGSKPLTARAYDNMGVDVTTTTSFSWSLANDGGSIAGNGSMATFTASSVAGVYIIRATGMRNGKSANGNSLATVTAIVPPPVNHNPVLNPVGPIALLVDEPGMWQSNATDQDGDTLSYLWTLNGEDGGWRNPLFNYTFIYAHVARVYVSVTDGRGGEAHYEWMVTITEPVPQGPTWGGMPFDQALLGLDVNPDGPADYDGTHVIGLDSTRSQDSNPFIADVFYNGALVISGSQGRYWSMTLTTTAPSGSLTADGIFHSAVSGPGVYLVTAHFVINTLPDPLSDLSITRRIRVD